MSEPLTSIETIVIHHSGSSRNATRDDIRGWHVDRNHWEDIGYHYVIEGDGALLTGRRLPQSGAHCYHHNGDTIGICVVGDNTKASAVWTPAQIVTLRELVSALRLVFGDVELAGHRDLAGTSTECPGIDVVALFQSRG